MVIFSFHRKIRSEFITGVIILLMLANIYTLATERKHFELFYHQPYEELFKTALLDNRNEDVFIIDDCIPYYNEYYFKKFDKASNYFTKRNTDIDRAGFRNIIGGIEEDRVIAHSIDAEEYRIIKEYFPYMGSLKQGFTYDIYTFSKTNGNELPHYDSLLAFTDFNSSRGNWENADNDIHFDTLLNTYYLTLDTTDIWGPSIILDLNEITPHGYGIVDIAVECVFEDKVSKTLLVGSITENKETLFWTAANAVEYIQEAGDIFSFYLGIDLQTALSGRNNMSDLKLKFNIWNKNKIKLKIISMKVSLRSGNPIRYGLYSKI